MRDNFIATLLDSAKNDRDIILITGDLGFAVFDEFIKQLPNQFINAGVAEQNMTGLAAGLALAGKKVFTYSIANFVSLRCLEQIRSDVCYHNLPVTAVCIGAGFSYGQLGISHHATEDLAIMRSLPKMTVISPATIPEVTAAVKTIINLKTPAYLRLDKSSAAEKSDFIDKEFILSEPRILRNGTAITLIGTGGILEEVLNAASMLEADGISTRVINVHTVKPINPKKLIDASTETGGIITIEEHTVIGGLGSAIGEILLEENTPPKFFHRMGLKSEFSSVVGSQQYLRKIYGLDAEAIYKSAKEKLGRDHKVLLSAS